MNDEKPQFKSFLWGGFECAAPIIETRKRIDILSLTKHDTCPQADYRLLKEIGIHTVREGFTWSSIDKGKGEYDFGRFKKILEAGKEENIQQVWDLNHFDYPEYLDLFSDEFPKVFARYAEACIRVIKKYQQGQIYIVPFNEISFFTYMGATIGLWAPHQVTRGFQLKRQCVKASIAAMEAIWKIDKDVRFIQVDPLFYRVPKAPATEVMRTLAETFKHIKFQTFDMLAGKLEPELGGQPKYLDILGANYYQYNQEWVTGDDPLDSSCRELMPFNSKSRVLLATLLKEMYDRYKRPIVITETGSVGEDRERWWKRLFSEVDDSIEKSLPVLGVCAYPVIDRPDWQDFHLTNSGLWDFKDGDKTCTRHPHKQLLEMFKKYAEKKLKR
jgi:beta-glucosidase/6-phospho-beta-glucosidase/beta-galactosidase